MNSYNNIISKSNLPTGVENPFSYTGLSNLRNAVSEAPQ